MHHSQYKFQLDDFADEDLIMRLPNDKNRNKTPEMNTKDEKKIEFFQETKERNEYNLNQLETNNHYVLGYN